MAAKSLILDDFIPYRLSVTSNVVSDVIASAYEALFGLSIPEWRVIAVVAENDGVTQQEICAKTRMDKVTVSRATIALVDRGLIVRTPNRADRRSRLLTLTKAGQKLYADVAPKAIEFEGRIFNHFPVEELDRFISMLRAIEARALAVGDGG
ncbi:MarR family winged helix-turn-helix transcriptional regulator [Sphingomonas sp. SRS2]|uniref:MarR family winged helix-turn-helix transcriptional regulator n=1 Tax=Sphingomonas sp. SRS2 TaxID=133190 RepID=UPI0006184E27|nr:MarR family winged helix-turn-helix transcriptional regulator [Sphingomonas sp. SRS2]KKC27366.1 MarR family transcriptional regulator [Sphingomonas sp. SRS2]